MDMEESNRNLKIAHVFVDMVSLVDDDAETGPELGDQMGLAARQAIDLGGIMIDTSSGRTVIDATGVIAGALTAIGSLITLAQAEGVFSDHDALVARWREEIDRG